MGGGQDVGRLRHEVDAAEHDVGRLGTRRRLPGQLERVAGDVGEPDDLVPLVVVAEHEHPVAERRLGGAGPLDQGRVGGGGSSPGQSTPRSLAGSAPLPSSSSGRSRTGVVTAVSPFATGLIVALTTNDGTSPARW